MFVRRKGNKFYLVENQRIDGSVRQRTVKYLGVNPTVGGEYLPKLNVIHNADVVQFLKTFPSNSIDCIIADPPYFISKKRTFKRREKDIERDFGEWDNGDFESFFESWLPDCFRILKHNLFLFTRFEKIQYLSEKYPEYYKSTIVWHKTNPAPHFMKNTFISSCEPILFFQKAKGLFNFLNTNEMHNFIETPKTPNNRGRFHPTQKHEQVIEWLLKIGTQKNSLLLDLFSGSATASKVALKLGLNFIAVESDQAYVLKARKIISL